jgi:peptide/nickel transport system substrate-binding protein
MKFHKLATLALLASVASLPAFAQQKTITAVMHADLKIIDPVWTTAIISSSHGHMIYDTLFAADSKGNIKPQMVDKLTISPDNLLYTFTLREGLMFHDGAPVTSEDVIPSLKRWVAKDGTGQLVGTFIESYTAIDAKTFTIKMKEPNGIFMNAMGKPTSSTPFIMPKRVAETDPNTQISDTIGSGPFIFKKDEWKPGDKAVYVKNEKYVPRNEPADGFAGGKVVKVDRVEWKVLADQQQAINALQRGEVDIIEQPTHDLLPLIKNDPNIKLVNYNPLGLQFNFRFNVLTKPFDNPKIRQAMFYAFNQEDFLKGQVGDADYYKTCLSLFPCGSPLASTAGTDGMLTGNVAKAKALLAEAGYDGTPVVLMHSTDLAILAQLAPIAKQQLEKVGMKVDMQSMDWATLVGRRVKKDAADKGGWSGFFTAWPSISINNPANTVFLNAGGEKALFGWPNDAEIERLRGAFAREPDVAKQKQIAEATQLRYLQYPTHVHLGQYFVPAAMRKNISGNAEAALIMFWGLEKK